MLYLTVIQRVLILCSVRFIPNSLAGSVGSFVESGRDIAATVVTNFQLRQIVGRDHETEAKAQSLPLPASRCWAMPKVAPKALRHDRVHQWVRDEEAAIQKAEANKMTTIKHAEADAESKYLQGQGIARQRLAIVSI